MTTTRPAGPTLDPKVTILVRPSGVIQLGWDPERAVLLTSPDLHADAILAFLRLLDGLRSAPQIIWRADEQGIAPDSALALLSTIDEAGLLLHPEARTRRVRSVQVHGLGPLADAVTAGLRRIGLRPSRSRDVRPDTAVTGWKADLVVLTDALVTDPRLANELVLHRIPHLSVRIRDNKGLVGPFVLPGETSCLRCADLTRSDFDPDWPIMAAQLLGRVGHASPAGVAATSALALGELEAIIECSPRRALDTLDATLELDLDSRLVERRRWAPHAACGCRGVAADPDV